MKMIKTSYREYSYEDLTIEIFENYDQKERVNIKLFKGDQELASVEVFQMQSDYTRIVFNLMAKVMNDEFYKRKQESRSAKDELLGS